MLGKRSGQKVTDAISNAVKNQEKPFTGIKQEFYKDKESLKSEHYYEDGKPTGKSAHYYKDGTIRAVYKDNVLTEHYSPWGTPNLEDYNFLVNYTKQSVINARKLGRSTSNKIMTDKVRTAVLTQDMIDQVIAGHRMGFNAE